MRLRMAPSPTGQLHIGTARTTLYNWLLARRSRGSFILRIEDTDLARSKPEYEQDILRGLKWLGLNWDEGPDIGGPYGPYRQTERAATYQKAIGALLKSRAAFWCFHTSEELTKEHELQAATKQLMIHVCEHAALPPEEPAARLKAGQKGIIRLKVKPGVINFDDAVRGVIKTQAETLGDFVIAKSMTEPLYNLAVVIDDHAMAITHVLRGEDHISNTPKQILIYQALEYAPPVFGHLPLILAEDRSKMSKRHGATSVAQYKAMGYLPETLINFLAFLGWNPGTDEELFTLQELIKVFSLERIRKSGAVFNKKRLDWLNGQYIRKLKPEAFIKACESFLNQAPLNLVCQGNTCKARSGEAWPLSQVHAIVAQEQTRIKTLAEVVPNIQFYFSGADFDYHASLLTWHKASVTDVKPALEAVFEKCSAIKATDWSKPKLEAALNDLLTAAADRGTILWPWRIALTGQEKSPGPFEVATLLGRERTLERLKMALTKLNP